MFSNYSFFASPTENVIAETAHMLKALNIKVSAGTIEDTLLGHPDYPSLLCISDALREWKVDNICLQVGEEKLDELPLPFMAYTASENGSFKAIDKINEDGSLSCFNKSNKRSVIRREDFLKQWDGVVLIPEATTASGERDYPQMRRKEMLQKSKAAFLLISCPCLIAAFTVSAFQPQVPSALFPPALALIKLAGSLVTSMLLWHEVDSSNPILQRICSAGKNTDCKAVLQSKRSTLFGVVSWSEIGFFYFASGFLSLILSADSPAVAIRFLAWLNLVSLPYTAFSIYYQRWVVRQWCPLCLSVQFLLLTEFAVFYFAFWGNGSQAPKGQPFISLPLILALLVPIWFWSFTKTIFIKARASGDVRVQLSRIKHNAQIFDSLLQKQKAIPNSAEGLGITLGDPGARNTLIKVCNPYCRPCANAHPSIEDLLKDTGHVKAQIIFNATSAQNDRRSLPVKHLMAIYEKGDNDLIKRALDDWYLPEKKDYRAFARKYPMNGELAKQDKKIDDMSEWCRKAQISFTPTFFLNGRQLPEIYNLNELKYFLSV